MKHFYIVILLLLGTDLYSQEETTVRIALMNYGGGGDWYSNPT